MNSEKHFLFSFLQQTLPSLGLDDEIYGPYLLGIFPQNENQSLAKIDEEELNNVLDLLQGSSQTHASDREAFKTLGKELLERYEQYWCEYRIKMEQLKKDAKKQQEEQRRRQETEEFQELAVEENKKERRKDPEEDLVKLRVIQQYAYDDSITYDANGDPIDTTNENKGREDEALITGKGYRFHSTTNNNNVGKDQQPTPKPGTEKSKKTAREETARQKLMRIQAKEERRKRAIKGERRR